MKTIDKFVDMLTNKNFETNWENFWKEQELNAKYEEYFTRKDELVECKD